MAARDDSLILLTKLHHQALQILSTASERPIQGLQQGGRLLKLPTAWQRKLRDIDVCAAWARHITHQKIDAVMDDLQKVLKLGPGGKSEPTDNGFMPGGRKGKGKGDTHTVSGALIPDGIDTAGPTPVGKSEPTEIVLMPGGTKGKGKGGIHDVSGELIPDGVDPEVPPMAPAPVLTDLSLVVDKPPENVRDWLWNIHLVLHAAVASGKDIGLPVDALPDKYNDILGYPIRAQSYLVIGPDGLPGALKRVPHILKLRSFGDQVHVLPALPSNTTKNEMISIDVAYRGKLIQKNAQIGAMNKT